MPIICVKLLFPKKHYNKELILCIRKNALKWVIKQGIFYRYLFIEMHEQTFP